MNCFIEVKTKKLEIIINCLNIVNDTACVSFDLSLNHNIITIDFNFNYDELLEYQLEICEELIKHNFKEFIVKGVVNYPYEETFLKSHDDLIRHVKILNLLDS